MTNRIKELRKEHLMTQAELAEKLGVSSRALGNYERGDRGLNKETLAKLADIFDVSPGYVLGETTSEEIITAMMTFYNHPERITEKSGHGTASVYFVGNKKAVTVGFKQSYHDLVDRYFIGNGVVQYNVERKNALSQSQATDLGFWQKQFAWLLQKKEIELIEKAEPGTVSELEIVEICANLIAAESEPQLRPRLMYSKENKRFIMLNTDFVKRLMGRQQFLAINRVLSDEPIALDEDDNPAYTVKGYTWELGLPTKELKDLTK